MNKYESLLKQWCDSMVALQIKGFGAPHDGGLLCKSCTALHGRVDNAVFPLVYMFKLTDDKKYYNSAKMLFKWQERLIKPDGGVYNDGNNSWVGITTFSCICFSKTLKYLDEVLDNEFKQQITQRVKIQAEWIYKYMGSRHRSNINYYAATAASMALSGELFLEQKYLDRSRERLDYCMKHFTENGLLMGEGHPHDGISARGCRPVDIGYDFEESIPCLTDAAEVLGDEETLKTLAHNVLNTLDMFMPDGGVDNSFGTRNNKWTYYGSRTSDGCAAALITLSKYAPQLSEAAVRNIDLQMECTHDGLLYGGKQYFELGQEPCTHHTVCHAAGLADALICGLNEDLPRYSLPCDNGGFSYKYYPEIDTYKINAGDWLATVTGCDYRTDLFYNGAATASGGTLTMLYNKQTGPVIAASTYEYKLVEPLNMQLPNEYKFSHKTLIPRVEKTVDNAIFATCFDNQAKISTVSDGDCVKVLVKAKLYEFKGNSKRELGIEVHSRYVFEYNRVKIDLTILGNRDHKCAFILPIIGDTLVKTENEHITDNIFYLSGGFKATEYTLYPDANAEIHVELIAD